MLNRKFKNTNIFMTSLQILLLVLTFGYVSHLSAQENKPTTLNKSEIESIVRAYILGHPEIIPEAIEILQDRERMAEQEALKFAISSKKHLIENDGFSMVGGNPNGDVTITEFYDYRCPFCSRSHADVLRLIEEDKNLRVVYKQFPVKDRPGEPQISLKASQMAVSANRQGKFKEFHHMAIMEGTGLTDLKLRVIAKNLDLDKEQLKTDMEDPEVIDQIRKNMMLARDLGITGTPTFVIGNEVIVGARGYDLLKQTIDRTRKSQKNPKPN